MDNLTDQRQKFDYAGTTGGLTSAGTPTMPLEAFYTLPGRSVFVNVNVPLNF